MKILHLSSEYPPAKVYGLGRFVHGLARAQAAAGDHVSVLTNSCGGDQDGAVVDGVHLHRIEFPNPPRPADGHGEVLQFNHGLVARFFDRRAAFADVDVICGHDWLTALAAREIAQELNVPLVVTIHDEVIGKRFGNLEREDRLVRDLEALTVHDATWVIANSDFIATQVKKHYGVERVTAIPGGIDPQVVAPKGGVREWRSIVAEDDEILATFVGRLDPEKGLEELADAALVAGMVKPKLRFAIAGTGKGEAILRKKLQPLGDRVKLLGYVKGEALSLLYRASDIVLVPSLYEPFGLVALESMLAGAAVVVSSAGGLAEIVRHDRDGLVVPPGDHVALAESIVQLAHEPDLRARLAASAQERARAEFSWARIAERTRPVYQHAIETKRPVCPSPPIEPDRPLVSVTIVTHNAPVHVETTLRSLFQRTDYPNLEAIVVDNASASTERLEAVIDELRREGRQIDLLRNDQNELFSKGQNAAIRRARGEFICMLNDDTEIPHGSEQWLRGLVWLLETYKAGTVTPVTIERDGRIYCAGAFDWGGHHLMGERDRDELVSAPRRTEWNNMACLLTRRRYFEEVGPLLEDEEHAHYKSDREWCLRLTRALELEHWVHPVRIYHYAAEASRRPSAPFQATIQTRLPASIVVVAYNNLAYTRDCIESILAETPKPFELVLVDNGSNDGTREYFHSLRDSLGGDIAVQIVASSENLGYPVGANRGIRAARGAHVVLLNNDTVVKRGWLEALLDAGRGERVGVVTAKILNLDGTVQNAGGILHHPDGAFTIPHANEDRLAPPLSERTEVASAGGPCMLLTRTLLEQVGVFDEGFSPGYFEDSDLCLRARAKELRLIYEPKAEVYHHGKATSSAVAREGAIDIWAHFESNKKTFYDRWRPMIEADEAERRRRARPKRRRRQKLLLCYHESTTTTAAYCEQALRRSHDVITAGEGQDLDLGPGATAQELVREAGGDVDVLLVVEGRNYVPREVEQAPCPTALWAIDNHLHARTPEGAHFALARAFDHVFVAQRDFVPSFAERGIAARWLPLACSPDLHALAPQERDLDVVFVGHVLRIHERRRRYLGRLRDSFQLVERHDLFGADMARLYARAKIVFNCSLDGDLNMRVFEGLASGALVVTDRIQNGLETLFGDGEHLALYDDRNLEAVAARFLADDGLRESVAARGRKLVTRFHSYEARMDQLLSEVESARGAQRVKEVVS